MQDKSRDADGWRFETPLPIVPNVELNSELLETDAENYMNPIPYQELIQKLLSTGKRCGSVPPSPLPGFKWDATFSTCNDLSTLYTTPIKLGNVAKERLHLLYHDASDVAVIPSKLSMIGVFTACPGDEDGSNRRIGAAVNALRSLMLQVEGSGIVGEPIAKF